MPSVRQVAFVTISHSPYAWMCSVGVSGLFGTSGVLGVSGLFGASGIKVSLSLSSICPQAAIDVARATMKRIDKKTLKKRFIILSPYTNNFNVYFSRKKLDYFFKYSMW